MTDCIVIGGGLIGMLTARVLGRAGLSVTLLERARTGMESSWAGGGILSPLYPWQYPEAVTRLAGWGQAYYQGFAAELMEETGIDPEWTRSGLLIMDTAEQGLALEWAGRHRLVMDSIAGAAMREVEPHLTPTADTALWMPDVAQIRNPRFVKALRRSLELSGIVIEEQTEVTTLLRKVDRITGVSTTRGEKMADMVVVTSGAWSANLLRVLGMTLDIVPVRGQMLLYKTEPGLIRRIILAKGHYAIPRRDGHVLVGSTVEYSDFDKSTTAEGREVLQQAAVDLIPELAGYDIINHWAGLRPGSPRGVPYIGAHPDYEGLYINTGHFRNGVVLGPASARLVSDIILKRTCILDPADYRLNH